MLLRTLKEDLENATFKKSHDLFLSTSAFFAKKDQFLGKAVIDLMYVVNEVIVRLY